MFAGGPDVPAKQKAVSGRLSMFFQKIKSAISYPKSVTGPAPAYSDVTYTSVGLVVSAFARVSLVCFVVEASTLGSRI